MKQFIFEPLDKSLMLLRIAMRKHLDCIAMIRMIWVLQRRIIWLTPGSKIHRGHRYRMRSGHPTTGTTRSKERACNM